MSYIFYNISQMWEANARNGIYHNSWRIGKGYRLAFRGVSATCINQKLYIGPSSITLQPYFVIGG